MVTANTAKANKSRIFVSLTAKKYIDSMLGKNSPFATQEEVVDHIVKQCQLVGLLDEIMLDRVNAIADQLNMNVEDIVCDAVKRRIESLENQLKKLQTIQDGSNDLLASVKGVSGVALRRIDNCVQEIMAENDKAENWWDKTFITQGSILKRISARTKNIKDYLEAKKDVIEQHHIKHSDLDPEHALDEDFNRKKAIQLQKQRAKVAAVLE